MSTPLTIERAKELLNQSTSEKHLQQHALAVSAALGQMAVYFNEDVPYWQAVGYLHDYDYENYPDEHLQHTQQPLLDAGVDEISVRAILSHGYGICTDIEPLTNLEKSLYSVDELTGLISATAKMRPNGIADIKASSVKKKFKDKKFAAKIDRRVILNGCKMLGIDLSELIGLCIQGMQPYAKELDLLGTAAK